MKKSFYVALCMLCILLFAPQPALSQKDVAGGKDHPLFNRMPGFYIQEYDEKEFDGHEFRDAKQNPVKVEGHLFIIRYALKNGAKEPSRLEILRNYEKAVKKIGGTILCSDWEGSSFMKVVKDNKEAWIQVDAYMTYQPNLYIVEKDTMAQKIVANAAVFAGDIRTTGHAAVYGIYFDTGKSVIKPESEAALSEIAKMLKKDASLKLNVVGHTDNVGKLDGNMKLSQDRGNAVVQALVTKHGIAAARLKGCGVGSLAPVASNDNEAGRAKNRRVELVKQ